MESKYTILSRGEQPCCIPGCPVMIERSQLLLDTVTNQVLLQLKMKNISGEGIFAVTVDIQCQASGGEQLPGVQAFPYMALAAEPGMDFGGRTAIPLPDNAARAAQVCIAQVVCENGTIWSNEKGLPPTEEMCVPQLLTMPGQDLFTHFQNAYHRAP